MLMFKSGDAVDQLAFVDARGNTFPIAGKLPANCNVLGEGAASDVMFAMRSEPVDLSVTDDVMFAMRSEPVEPSVMDDVMFAMRSEPVEPSVMDDVMFAMRSEPTCTN